MPNLLPTSPPVFTHIDPDVPLRCHEHLAVIRRGGGWAPTGAEFLREGLGRGQRCCYLARPVRCRAMLGRLRALGVDMERTLAERKLQVPPPARCAGDWAAWANGFFAEAEIAGAPAVRWLEEGVGAMPVGASVPEFMELHSRLNYLVKQYPGVAVCHYDVEQLETSHLFHAIAVHRHLLVEGTLVRDNPFYIPAEKFHALQPEDRDRNLRELFREVGFDLEMLFSILAGYGRLQRQAPPGI